MTTISGLRVIGWKSIKDAKIEFGPLNVLIGANGAGKSNLLSFFKFLQALIDGKMELFVGQEGGANTLLYNGLKRTQQLSAALTTGTPQGALTFETCLTHGQPDNLIVNPYLLDLAKPHNGEKITNLSVSGRIVGWIRQQGEMDGEAILNSLLKNIRQCHFHDTSATAGLRLTGNIQDNRSLHGDASNLAAMLYLYQQTRPMVFRRILETVRQVAPFLECFVLEPQRLKPESMLLNWKTRSSEAVFGPHQFSDGTLRFIALATLLLQPTDTLPSFLIVDEPELGLHPAALNLAAGMLHSASHHCQIIVATQSPAFVDEFDPENVIVVDRQEDQSTFRRLESGALAEWLKDYSLGQLWEKNIIGGGPFG